MSEPLPQRRRRSRSRKRSKSRSQSRSRSKSRVPVVRTVATEVKHVQFSSGKPVATANVEREVATVTRVGKRSAGRRNYRSNKTHYTNAEKKLDRAIKNVKRKLNGPTVQDTFSLTLTLGTIDGTTDDGLNRQMRYPLNPVLLKIDDSGKATTPLSERAHQYNLWKLLHCSVQLTPLVNASNVTGTVAYVDLDEEGGTVSPETVDTIKAKLHAEVFVGQKVIFTIAAKKLEGPRQTWWWVDTNEEAEESLGPALDFWTYLQTRNLLGVNVTGAGEQTTSYTGPLWLAEMRVKYAFSNYMPKPALALLTNEKIAVSNFQLETGSNGELVISGTTNSRAFRASGTTKIKAVSRATTSDANLSTAIYMWVDDGIKTLAPALGVWGWLLKAGWFVVRQILPGTTGLAEANTFKAVVYPSVKAAQDHEPVIVGSLSGLNFTSLQIQETTARIQQINAPNVNDPTDVTLGDVLQTSEGQIAYPLLSEHRRERQIFNIQGKAPNMSGQAFCVDGPSVMMRVTKIGSSSAALSNPDILNSGFAFSVAVETKKWEGVQKAAYQYTLPDISNVPEQNIKSIVPAVRVWKISDSNTAMIRTGLFGTLLQDPGVNSAYAGDLTSFVQTILEDGPNELNGAYWITEWRDSAPQGQTQPLNKQPTVWGKNGSQYPISFLWDIFQQAGASAQWQNVLGQVTANRVYMIPVVNGTTNISNNGTVVKNLFLPGVVLIAPSIGEAVWFGFHQYLRDINGIDGPINFNTTLYHSWNNGQDFVNWLSTPKTVKDDDDDSDISLQEFIDECDFSFSGSFEGPSCKAEVVLETEKTLREERDYWMNLAKDLMLKNSQN
nr:MAG: capsid protein [Astroviridae sp.]